MKDIAGDDRHHGRIGKQQQIDEQRNPNDRHNDGLGPDIGKSLT